MREDGGSSRTSSANTRHADLRVPQQCRRTSEIWLSALTSCGDASPRWKTARYCSEADRLNQRLSELRATNVRKAVEQVLRTELPGLPITVSSKGLGSQQRFPSATEDNAAVDRSVVVTIDLTTTTPTYKAKASAPAGSTYQARSGPLGSSTWQEWAKACPSRQPSSACPCAIPTLVRNQTIGNSRWRRRADAFWGWKTEVVHAGCPTETIQTGQICQQTNRARSRFLDARGTDFDDFKNKLGTAGVRGTGFRSEDKVYLSQIRWPGYQA